MPITKQPQIIPQHRDRSLIRMLAEDFRILIGEQIDELVPMGSVTRRNFRLKQLCDAGYLSSRSIPAPGRPNRLAYYLGSRAWELFDDPAEKNLLLSLHKQASQLAPSALEHRIIVDTIHIRFLTAEWQYPEYRLLTWIDQYSPSWESIREYGVPVQADGYGEYILLMHFDSLLTFFLEVDITERAEILRDKVERYIAFAESGNYERLFAASPFRVLFVTSSQNKLEGLAKFIGSRTDKSFWITTWEEFKHSKLFDAYWVRPGLEGRHSLLSHP